MHVQELLDAIDQIQSVDDPQKVLDLTAAALSQYGFTAFVITGLPYRGQSIEGHILLSGWPTEWYERYVFSDYVHVDPVAQRCFGTAEPFFWTEASFDRQKNRTAARVMNEAADIGMNEGFCVPMHMEDGSQGCISMGAERIEMPHEARVLLHMLGIYSFFRARLLKNPSPARRLLTPRETEILTWAAVGKTNRDISETLGITERTILDHFQNAGRKLETRTRTQAVAMALQYRLIQP
ncbi:LuxR family transcriptional regulator [Jiella endophytica]|uniref:LuxR family transcriptional regulator n=1 Tax=Jiella endophytica TaxID=2558362 RepID=A0A4Y8RFQ8_9HYPH|nr:autoinducer binding domain-containing protein [Jiella endophytica]TFF20839.1 LuxR family transcriptional regulator [Jiella endophytica]